MQKQSLAMTFSDSLTDDAVSCISNLAEVGLDSISEEGLLKDVPLISTAISVYKIGSSIKERHNLKKMIVFLNEINNSIADEIKRSAYRAKFQENEKFRDQEIEYLLVLIDRCISYDKPRMLAKLYLAYLDEIIMWEEFITYAEVIERLLTTDLKILLSDEQVYMASRNIGSESILRLMALGLMCEVTNNSPFDPDGRGGFMLSMDSMQRISQKERKYMKTEFGEKLASILS